MGAELSRGQGRLLGPAAYRAEKEQLTQRGFSQGFRGAAIENLRQGSLARVIGYQRQRWPASKGTRVKGGPRERLPA